MKKAMLFIKKIKKIEFFYKKVLTKKKCNDNITLVQKTENGKEVNKMEFKEIISDFSMLSDENIIFDFSKLRGKIKEVYGTQNAFATEMVMNEATLSNKLNNNVEFSPKEIVRACYLLEISFEEIKPYFFTLKVQETERK